VSRSRFIRPALAAAAAALALTLSGCASGTVVHSVRLSAADLARLARVEELRRLDDAGELVGDPLPDPDCSAAADNASDWCVELRAAEAARALRAAGVDCADFDDDAFAFCVDALRGAL